MVCNKAKECITKSFNTSESIDCSSKIMCLEYRDVRKMAKCEENGMIYTIDNRKLNCHISLFRIDDAMITGADISKCDYLFTFEKNSINYAIFVELKGTDITHAMEQIFSAVQHLKICENQTIRIYARIIHNGGVPNLFQTTPQYSKLYKVIQKTNGNIQLRRLSLVEKIESI